MIITSNKWVNRELIKREGRGGEKKRGSWGALVCRYIPDSRRRPNPYCLHERREPVGNMARKRERQVLLVKKKGHYYYYYDTHGHGHTMVTVRFFFFFFVSFGLDEKRVADESLRERVTWEELRRRHDDDDDIRSQRWAFFSSSFFFFFFFCFCRAAFKRLLVISSWFHTVSASPSSSFPSFSTLTFMRLQRLQSPSSKGSLCSRLYN